MINRDRSDINLLVTDYDMCAFTNMSTHRYLLSNSLLKYVNNMRFDGFYGCTHRCFITLPELKNRWLARASESYSSEEKILSNYSTYSVSVNLAAETGLSCKTVSTLDDIMLGECGYGYESIIKPYETDQVIPENNLNYIKSTVEVNLHYNSKNIQLTQIARHAAENYPSTTSISMHYFDDKESLCEQALLVSNDNDNWPKNVSIEVYHHRANSDDAPIALYTANGLMQRYGMFELPTTNVLTDKISVERKKCPMGILSLLPK